MTTATAPTNPTPAKRQDQPLAWMQSPTTMAALKSACASHVTPERIVRVALTAANRQPKLLQCTKESLWQAILDCAAMGLEPDAWGRAYLVPYEDRRNNRVLAQLIIGYKGLVELAMRSGRVRSIKAEVVCERDRFEYAFGLTEKLEHVPAQGDRGRPTHVYAYALLTDHGHVFEVMSAADVERIRTRSRAKDNGPWTTDWDMMARKTAIRRLAKLLPLSPEFRDAVERDDREDPTLDLPAITMGGDAPPTVDTTAEHVGPEGEVLAGDQPPADAPATKANPFAGKGAGQ